DVPLARAAEPAVLALARREVAPLLRALEIEGDVRGARDPRRAALDQRPRDARAPAGGEHRRGPPQPGRAWLEAVVLGRQRGERLLDAHELGLGRVAVLLQPVGIDFAARQIALADRAQQVGLDLVARYERRQRPLQRGLEVGV